MSDKWDRHWISTALHHARMSKDPDKQVGSVVISPDEIQLSMGFNGFPRGIRDSAARLHDKDLKRKLMVHAERNALLNAVRVGTRLYGCTLYLAAIDESGPHGGCPCTACTIEVIQAGISSVVSIQPKENSSWSQDILFARDLLKEAQIEYREIVYP